jgi:hypothetical protein
VGPVWVLGLLLHALAAMAMPACSSSDGSGVQACAFIGPYLLATLHACWGWSLLVLVAICCDWDRVGQQLRAMLLFQFTRYAACGTQQHWWAACRSCQCELLGVIMGCVR